MRISCVSVGMMAIVLGVCALAQTRTIPASAERMKVYSDPVGRVSFRYPESWESWPLSDDDISTLIDEGPVSGFSVRARDTGVGSIRFVYRVITSLSGDACRTRFQYLAGEHVPVSSRLVNGRRFFYARSGGVATAQSFNADMYGLPWRGNCLLFEDAANTHFSADYDDSEGNENRIGRRKDARAEARIAAIIRSIRLR